MILSLSPRFALPYENISRTPIYHLLAETESIIKTTPDRAIQDETRNNIANSIHNYINGFHTINNPDSTTKLLQRSYKVTAKFLKSNPNVCILPEDKGNRTVVMVLSDYVQKMKSMLADTDTYLLVQSYPKFRL